MGLFSRKEKQPVDTGDSGAATTGITVARPEPPELPEDYDGRPMTSRLTQQERDRISQGLATLADRGIDVDDLGSISAAYDAAYDAAHAGGPDGPDVVVELFGIAIGEHLVRHSARGWSVVTDIFGTDLGVVPAKADAVVVPHNLVSARWMRGERRWIPNVVSHLVSLSPRA